MFRKYQKSLTHRLQAKKLNPSGFSHDLMLVVIAVIIAIIGVGFIVASHADSCPTASGATSGVSSPASSTCCALASGVTPASGPVSGCSPTSAPASSPTVLAAGEQLTQPPQNRPAQYVHVCRRSHEVYLAQGTPKCLPGGAYQNDASTPYPANVYNIACENTTGKWLKYGYISSQEHCPAGSIQVIAKSQI